MELIDIKDAQSKIILLENLKNKTLTYTEKIKLIPRLTKEDTDFLDILIRDKDYYIRAKVAKKGYGLNRLINDDDPCVRKEVARKSYKLDVLIKDEKLFVREEAKQQLLKNQQK